MKIQWSEDSLRVRLSPQDLRQLEHAGALHAVLALPGGWTLRLERGGSSGLSMQDGVLVFSLSSEDHAYLLEPEREGVYFREGALEFFVEKDRHRF